MARPPRPVSAASATIRVAAAGDVHCRPSHREEAIAAFAAIEGKADVLLLAGDLTNHGTPEEGAVVADACRGLSMPVFAVLGNHDWHEDRTGELIATVQEGGVRVLDREAASVDVGGVDVGVVGVKGFVGGFPGSHLPDFGEPLLREVYRETQREVDALDAGLADVASCSVRLVVMHYAPTAQTLAGEPEGIHAFLGSDRLAAPLRQHEPELVVHGHAHAGTFEGRVDDVPVFNVSVPVMGQPFWVFDVAVPARDAPRVH
jgi:Icc-related predicted phosphoesterase